MELHLVVLEEVDLRGAVVELQNDDVKLLICLNDSAKFQNMMIYSSLSLLCSLKSHTSESW